MDGWMDGWMENENGRDGGDLEDPLVHDDDGDVEAPPL
jgi:hypothetical protein